MKIAIIGYSGSGKSTLAKHMGGLCGAPVLHLDQVHWLPGWIERERADELALVGAFLGRHGSWVIDGNYTKLCFDRRMAEADQIVLLCLGRWACLWRVWRRWLRNRGHARPDMTQGCADKLDWEFVRWILWDGRSGKKRQMIRNVMSSYPEKCTLLKNQRQLTAFYSKLSIMGSIR